MTFLLRSLCLSSLATHSDNDLIWHTFGWDQSHATKYGRDHLVGYVLAIMPENMGFDITIGRFHLVTLSVFLFIRVCSTTKMICMIIFILGTELEVKRVVLYTIRWQNWACKDMEVDFTFCLFAPFMKKGSARGPPLSTQFGGRFWRSLKVCSSEKEREISHSAPLARY